MRLLGIIAALAIGLAGGSAALAQHGTHHGRGGMGMGSSSDEMTMACCESMTDMCDPAACPAHKEKKDGKVDMTKCCKMKESKGDTMMNHGSGDMGSMGEMMCGEKMKCCKKMPANPDAGTADSALPTLE